jgi:hypothetical protein
MPKAWGEVTSWIRWVPMMSCVWPFANVRAVCADQTFSNNDLGMVTGIFEKDETDERRIYQKLAITGNTCFVFCDASRVSISI